MAVYTFTETGESINKYLGKIKTESKEQNIFILLTFDCN